jgi:hypothetical protein
MKKGHTTTACLYWALKWDKQEGFPGFAHPE